MSNVEHGRSGTYTNHRCRCQDCRRAHSKVIRDRKAVRHSMRVEVGGRLVAAHLPDDKHGNPNTYSNWGCRCAECTEAWTDSYRIRRERAS